MLGSKVSSVRLSGWGPSHCSPLEPAMLTQHFAPILSAKARRCLQRLLEFPDNVLSHDSYFIIRLLIVGAACGGELSLEFHKLSC